MNSSMTSSMSSVASRYVHKYTQINYIQIMFFVLVVNLICLHAILDISIKVIFIFFYLIMYSVMLLMLSKKKIV